MSKEVIETLRKQAGEIAREGHNGWGNTMTAAADALGVLLEENELLKATQYGSGRMQALRDERDALLAERDALLRQVDTLTEWYSNSLDVINDITAALPGTQYMDPPDGGDVSVPEQVRRMAKDAERWRHARKILTVEAIETAQAEFTRLGMPSAEAENIRADQAIDDALQGEQP